MSDDDESSAAGLIPGYNPYIADVSISKVSTPFPKQNQPILSPNELLRKKKKLSKYINARSFNPPLSLSDYCIIAKDRWNQDEDFAEEEKCCDHCEVA